MGKASQQDPSDLLRERTREAHATLKDLRQTIREATAVIETLKTVIADTTTERITGEVDRQLQVMAKALNAKMDEGVTIIAKQYEQMSDLLMRTSAKNKGTSDVSLLEAALYVAGGGSITRSTRIPVRIDTDVFPEGQ